MSFTSPRSVSENRTHKRLFPKCKEWRKPSMSAVGDGCAADRGTITSKTRDLAPWEWQNLLLTLTLENLTESQKAYTRSGSVACAGSVHRSPGLTGQQPQANLMPRDPVRCLVLKKQRGLHLRNEIQGRALVSKDTNIGTRTYINT